MGWIYFAVYVIAVVAIVIATTPKTQSQPPLGLGDVTAPTAEEGREIGVLFGTRDLDGPNVTWFGDIRTVAIKSKGGKK